MDNNASQTLPGDDLRPPPHKSRDLVYARTLQLALNAGRYAHEISKADYDQAMREVTGESDRMRQDAILDSAERRLLARVA
ncbi:hypothetical protein [Haloferula sp. BvORR071]|uniref:hypothetical protein n=1 Tax=Haloferula sp. BvORR071 TaxID=1396141 RepID=UPI002240EF3D|nr:hypothetical protein [Haloferula sp. BvORR071]